MEVLDQQGNTVVIDQGFRFGDDFFSLLNFIKRPETNDSGRNSAEEQSGIFYRDIMNYAFVDSHNQHLADKRFDLAAKNLNEINQLSLDPLTGLRKKEFLKRKLIALEQDIYLDNIATYSLIMCDLDEFKQVNDNFGHSVGDETLALFGKLVSESIRPSDFAYRYGGEEFLVVLPDTELVDAVIVAERIRKAIDDRLHVGHYGLNTITVHDLPKSAIDDSDNGNLNDTFFLARDLTCSFGVANYEDCGQSNDALFCCADENLYIAKEEGRNKVVY